MLVALMPGRYTNPDDGTIYGVEGSAGTVGAGSSNTYDTTTARYGPGSIKHVTGASGTVADMSYVFGLQGQYGYRYRRYFKFGTLPSSFPMDLITFYDNGVSSVIARLTAASKFQLLWNDGSDHPIGPPSNLSPSIGPWFYVELYAKFGASAGQCEVALIVGLDGGGEEVVAQKKGLTITTNMITQLAYGIVVNFDGSQTVWSCDGALSNDQGASRNDWQGQAKGSLISVPIADLAVGANWKDGAGGSSGLFGALGNIPPTAVADGSSTASTQIKNANAADVTGNYDATLQSYAEAGMPDGHYVSALHLIAGLGSSSATNVGAAIQLLSNPSQGAEDAFSSGRSAAADVWGTNWRGTPGTPQEFVNGGSPARLTRPTARVGRREAVATTLEVALLWIMFEWKACPSVGYLVLEDGSGRLMLEDGSGDLLLEDSALPRAGVPPGYQPVIVAQAVPRAASR